MESVLLKCTAEKCELAMKGVLTIFALACVAATQVTASCTFQLSTGNVYTCMVWDVVSRSPSDVIDLSGTHLDGRNDDDVTEIGFGRTAVIEEIREVGQTGNQLIS